MLRWVSIVIFVCLSSAAYAQDARGTITGRVADNSGASIAGASVEVLNNATGVPLNLRTNESGNFTAPFLPPGTYRLVTAAPGFKRTTQDNIQVRIGETSEVNLQLQVGDNKEEVTVTAETPLLATAEVSVGQVVDARRVEELPLFAGNAMDLVQLAPGTVNGTDLRLRKAPFNSAPSQFSTDGSGNNNNEFTIDGVTNLYSDGTLPRVAFSPPQTSVAEFKAVTTGFDATIGHTLGAVVNVSTRGGTNQFHGDAHEWLRHSMFDAPSIFQNRAGQKLAVYQDNRYGLSGGGPVIIPRLYNGSNKTFWFFAWEANKFGDPNVGQQTSTVPTAKMRQGDFSELLKLGPQYQIYDPFTTKSNGAGGFTRDPFPGNIIPASRLDPFGLKIANTWPLPNQPGTSDFRNNFFISGKALEDYWTTIGRVDQNFSEKHRVFIRMDRDYWQENKNHWFGDNITGVILNRINRGAAFDDVYMFNPGFLLNFRYGVTAQEFPERRSSRGFDLASLGFSPALTSLVPKDLATFPNVQAGSITQLANWESGDGVTSSLIHSFVANFTKTLGSHTVRFGPEFRIENEYRNRFNLDVSPQLSYTNTYTKASDTAAGPPVGGELASLLLNVPAGSMGQTASYAERDYYWALYAQDDWKIGRKLTLNIGLRWEHETPMSERYNRAVAQFAFDQSNPIEAQARANYAMSQIPELPLSQFVVRGGLTFAGVNGKPREYWKGQAGHFEPRVGVAYQITPKTVLRTGYGIFYGSIGVLYTNTVQTGFSASTPIQASLDNGLTYIATNANPFPTGLQQPSGASQGLRTNLGQNLTAFASDRKQPYAQRWLFGLERELPAGFVVEADYVGNRTTRLSVNRELNYTPQQYLSTSPVRDNARIAFLSQTSRNPFAGINPIYGNTITRANLLKPYPEFGSIQELDPVGYSWYHALQSRIERRFSKGVTLQISYTWSKAMEATQFLNDGDPVPYRTIAAIDRTHRLVSSGIWELPFGRGKMLGANWNRVTNFVAGGWQLNGLMQRQSGAPLGFGNYIFNGDLHSIPLSNSERSVD
ncbi:MAG: TonB-dependent receptor, partial [Acidobacteriota bacterium]|nr:TonB-dependent receptor [Acidobacteriota bacterium]